MKKVIAALGFCGLMSTSVSAMDLPYEVENGFTGMKRDIVLKLVDIICSDGLKVRSVIGMCDQHFAWKSHRQFVRSRYGTFLLTTTHGAIQYIIDQNRVSIELTDKARKVLKDMPTRGTSGLNKNYLLASIKSIGRAGDKDGWFLNFFWSSLTDTQELPNEKYLLTHLIIPSLGSDDAEGLLIRCYKMLCWTFEYPLQLVLLIEINKQKEINWIGHLCQYHPAYTEEQAQASALQTYTTIYAVIANEKEGNGPQNLGTLLEDLRYELGIEQNNLKRMKDTGKAYYVPEQEEDIRILEDLISIFEIKPH